MSASGRKQTSWSSLVTRPAACQRSSGPVPIYRPVRMPAVIKREPHSGNAFQERRSAMDGGRRSSYMDVLVRGPGKRCRCEARWPLTSSKQLFLFGSPRGAGLRFTAEAAPLSSRGSPGVHLPRRPCWCTSPPGCFRPKTDLTTVRAAHHPRC